MELDIRGEMTIELKLPHCFEGLNIVMNQQGGGDMLVQSEKILPKNSGHHTFQVSDGMIR
jgi:hypothetical protein